MYRTKILRLLNRQIKKHQKSLDNRKLTANQRFIEGRSLLDWILLAKITELEMLIEEVSRLVETEK
ncbi:MAG: hypothetical protein ACRCTJ_00775 [Brevinema sp.]